MSYSEEFAVFIFLRWVFQIKWEAKIKPLIVLMDI